jgi:WD40 repeat protein
VTGQEIHTIKLHDDSVYKRIAFSSDRKQFVVGINGVTDGVLEIWDVETGRKLRTITGHKGSIQSVTFGPDDFMIITCGFNGKIQGWHAQKGYKNNFFWNFHEANATGKEFSPDGRRIVSGIGSTTLKVWNVSSGKELFTLKGSDSSFKEVTFSPDSKQISCGSKSWSMETGGERSTIVNRNHSSSKASVLSVSPGREWLVCGSDIRHDHNDNDHYTIQIHNAYSGSMFRELRGHKGSINSVAFSPDGKRIISGSGDKTIKIWNAEPTR